MTMPSLSRSMRVVVTVARTWTHIYTTGLPEDLRQRRLAEIESDVWEQCNDSTDPTGDALVIIGRLLRGILDDLRWRLACVSTHPRWALATILAMAILTSSIWVVSATRSVPLPHPPAAPDLVTRKITYPTPPPPPPPPCNPPGIGRAPFTPCTPF